MNNLSSYCGLVDAKIRASDKDLPVLLSITSPYYFNSCSINNPWIIKMKPSCVTVISICCFYQFVLCCPSSPDCDNLEKLDELSEKLGVQEYKRSKLDRIEKSINRFKHPAQCKG